MDSMFEIKRLFKDSVWKPKTKFQWFLISFLTVFTCSWYFQEEDMTQAMQSIIFVALFAIILWVMTEAIPSFIVWMMTIIGSFPNGIANTTQTLEQNEIKFGGLFVGLLRPIVVVIRTVIVA